MQTQENIPQFYPYDKAAKWDNIEVEAVGMEDGVCYVVHDTVKDKKDIIFWSVYLHQKEGGVLCVADVATRDQAKALAELITNSSLSKSD